MGSENFGSGLLHLEARSLHRAASVVIIQSLTLYVKQLGVRIHEYRDLLRQEETGGKNREKGRH